MSDATTTLDTDRLEEMTKAGIDRMKRATGGDPSGTSSIGAAKELFDVLESTDALLETIDLDRVPDAIEVDELPSLIDLEHLSDALEEHDPDLVFDLSNLKEVIDERALWESVDLLGAARAKRRLDDELEDVLGEDASNRVGTDSKAVADAKEYVTSLRPEATKAALQQEARKKAEVVQNAVIEQHERLEEVYEANKARLTPPTRRGVTRNPTAVSLLSSDPLPDSVSTRLSTVPSAVPYAKIDALPRIHGRRWKRAVARRS